MVKGLRVDNEALLSAGLELMRKNGKPLSKLPSRGRSMLFSLQNGETVRARTCNDHILIVVADSTDGDANLNIEGTDWLLYIVPKEERMAGKVVAYLLPTRETVAEVRKKHWEWIDSNPNTKGSNTTWNLWFQPNGHEKANNYGQKWSKYRLQGEASTEPHSEAASIAEEPIQSSNIKGKVEAARQRIAHVAGVPFEAVKITIDFGV